MFVAVVTVKCFLSLSQNLTFPFYKKMQIFGILKARWLVGDVER